jgi:hypothetical protein
MGLVSTTVRLAPVNWPFRENCPPRASPAVETSAEALAASAAGTRQAVANRRPLTPSRNLIGYQLVELPLVESM